MQLAVKFPRNPCMSRMRPLSSIPSTHSSHGRRSFASSTTTRVGFVGLGNMGAPMAKNLLRAGNQVTVFDSNHETVKNLQAEGARAASSLQELASEQEYLVTMLPNAEIVRSVYQQLIPGASRGTLFIDSSTIDPSSSRELAGEVRAAGSEMVDAPVSGGVVGAQNATLTFMVGGNQEAFQKAELLLKYMGKNIAHCGEIGTGQIAKLCNNLILAISMIGVSEGMNLGARLGADPKVLASIINTSSGRCWSSDTYNPFPGVMEGVPSSRDFDGGFAVDLMLKDLGLAQTAASESETVLPLGDHAAKLYSEISRIGQGKKDFGVICKLLGQVTPAETTSDSVFGSLKQK